MTTNKHRRRAATMTSSAPDTSVKVTVPEYCRMRGVFTSEQNIQITVGKNADGVTLRFDRLALEQFADLALELLAVLHVGEPPERPVRIVRPGPPRVPDFTRGEDSAFIAALHTVQDQLGPYVRWLLHPDDPDVQPYEFADEMVLSTLTSALGYSIRELAYSRMSDDDAAQLTTKTSGEEQD